MHSILTRQLRKLGLKPHELPSTEAWVRFIADISQAFRGYDEDRYLMQRAMELSSKEMRELMDRLARQNEQLQTQIRQNAAHTDRLRHAATHDTLTGLPNRAALLEAATACIRERNGAAPSFALIFIDLDDFKVINDSLGHDIGDQVLKLLAERLDGVAHEAPETEPLTCRLGGDEFVILLRNINDSETAVDVADRLHDAMRKPFTLAHHSFVLSASMGLLVNDATYSDASEMLRDADAAMYRAKINGKAGHAVFHPGMHNESVQRLRVEQDLRAAIGKGQFHVAYQPVIQLESGQLTAFESLLRWRHPERGLVRPDFFLDVAEQTGLIVPIGREVLKHIAKDVRSWDQAGPKTHFRIAVNFSRRQLCEPSLIDDLLRVTDESNLTPDRLAVEVTESSVVADADQVTDVLRTIRERGCNVYMDDFGTGLSSLSSLHSMPFDAVKIDRAFMRHITEQRHHAAIVMSIVMLAHNLGLGVIGEGIESVDQLVQLQASDCDMGQGYLFSRPLNAHDVPDWIASEGVQWRQIRQAA
ncbi:MAG: EAL domain-containing protein [Phycisphaerales bacterium]|nr:EAL domain-containing protein [Phycisphaerales bacterium]